ncbi:MAG: hypothetical protein LBU70_07235 [Chitinispirillales bacterium]|jgi:hypothetical protein|nr:hypothetical protein [Chitinispirillales bacterium]
MPSVSSLIESRGSFFVREESAENRINLVRDRLKPDIRIGSQKTNWIIDCANTIHKLRIDIRILNDLQQIGINQWGFLNEQIEKLLDCVAKPPPRAAFFCGKKQKNEKNAISPCFSLSDSVY